MTALAIQTGRTLLGYVASRIEDVVANYKDWNRQRAERARIANELSMYSDRDLADLGFSRCDIPAIVNGTYSR